MEFPGHVRNPESLAFKSFPGFLSVWKLRLRSIFFGKKVEKWMLFENGWRVCT